MAIPRDDRFILIELWITRNCGRNYGGDFVDYLNYYEQIAYESKWFRIQND